MSTDRPPRPEDTPAREPAPREGTDEPRMTREDVERRATRVAAASFLIATAAALALIGVYWVGGQPRVEGLLLFAAFGGITVGLVLWAKVLIAEPEVEEERPQLRSTEEARAAFRETYDGAVAAEKDPRRRRFLTRLLLAAGTTLGAALLVPFRSLGELPGVSLFNTRWEEGSRVVSFDGEPIRAEDLAMGSVVTVFPEDHVGVVDSQVLLIRVPPDLLDLPEGAPDPIDGVVAFSKICTHAGCPVGLFRAAAGELFCPCHQSKFDVFRGAEPIGGPTTRALPQLALGTDDDGYLVALRDFDEPVGPGFWNMERGVRDA